VSSSISFIHPDTGEVFHTIETRESLDVAFSGERGRQHREKVVSEVGLETDADIAWGAMSLGCKQLSSHVFESHLSLRITGIRRLGPSSFTSVGTDSRVIEVVRRSDYTKA